jgi:hypothetical protein
MTKKPTRMPANAVVMLKQRRDRKVEAIARKLAKVDGDDLNAIPDYMGGEAKADEYRVLACQLLRIAER